MNVILFLSTISTVLGGEYTVTQQVYFDITIGKRPVGRLDIGLFGNNVPKTVKNFFTLSTKVVDGNTYKGTRFYKIIPGFIIHGGDIAWNNGTGPAVSIYGGEFDGEESKISHDCRGLVTMTDLGDHKFGSKFFILGGRMTWLDGTDVVIGKILNGFDVHKKIEEAGYYNGTTASPIVIADCGETVTEDPFVIKWEPEEPFIPGKSPQAVNFVA